MMGLFAEKAAIGDKVNLTLINGGVFEGKIESFGEDFTIIKTKRGTAGIYYKMVGAWEIFSDSNPDQSLEDPVSYMDPGSEITLLRIEPILESVNPESKNPESSGLESANEVMGQTQNPETGEEILENEADGCNLIEIRIEEALGDFKARVASAKLTLHEPDMSFPLNSLDSTHLQEDKKKWDKINSQYQNCIKNKNYSPLPSLVTELLKFAEKYPKIGVFHYNAGCYLVHLEAFRQAQSYFEEAFSREPLPEYIYNTAYAALKTNDYEKAHIGLAAYFNLIPLTEDPDAWYMFCSLTEKEFEYSTFEDVLLSLPGQKPGIEGAARKENEEYVNDTLPLLLKSALYVLQRDKKYKAAEPLITALQEKDPEHKTLDLKNVTSLLDLAFKNYPRQTCKEYERLIGYGKLTGLLNEYRGSRMENSSSIKSSPPINSPPIINPNNSSINSSNTSITSNNSPITPNNFAIITDKLKSSLDKIDSFNGNGPEDEAGRTMEEFCSKIPRKQGQIFKYLAPQGYGFIIGQDGKTYFFHVSAIIDSSISDVDLNNVYWGAQIQVIFQPIKGSQGDIAVQISAYPVVNEMQKLAEIYADSGDFGKAIEQIKYVLSIDSEHPDSRDLLEAWTKKQTEILEEERALNELIETDPGNTESWRSKVEFLIGHKRYEEALYTLDEVIRITPNFINSLSSKKQLSSFSELCDFNPEYVKAICKKGFVLYQLGMYKEVLGLANKILEIEPDHVGALCLKASSLLKLQRFQEAFEIVVLALDLDPKNGELLFLKGKALLKFHKYEEGLEYLEKAYQLTPKKPEVLLRKGYALSKLNRFEEALKAYDKMINIQPDNVKALSNKGFILVMTGKYEDALSLYNGLIQLNPFNSVLWSKKGAILTKMHRSEEALKAVDRALEIVPDDSDSLFTRGYIYSKNGMYDEALRHFNSVLELDPYDQKALAKKAFMLSRLGKHDEAFISIEDALKINWHNSRTWYYKGVLHYNIEEYDKALSAFNRSAELNLEDTRIEKMKQFTLSKLGIPEGKTGVAANTLKVEEELFDRELQEEYDLEFED
ncbi:hypothetical protein EO98_19100 [Methanosarcina sp. 2.H.T.1A.6]|uniref:tetratricopeptide repeat protein n=1 Tax=unclassified Methanosarcina TaxID=2644672 RepID=UPI000621D5BB|nr:MULTISPECIES: tetratricopeptide repeat protein [unclassified Methanosarcina]KKG16555.1 hypothetical protein EO94_07245 [Methanosarcina sp. 2.H.T.1A.3]KKG16660.1 hypothetical protein EO97_00440 [Methanosarcina sp. 2.H.T.1A.15]KKG19369.1 hypothetical protein EO98_19100 [Methanosarcina sp. 2.H.T.1A.6]KKG25589.1 hypothetical protein EO96_18745 [Methanosarcina sp. 2.H.T.1A.8]